MKFPAITPRLFKGCRAIASSKNRPWLLAAVGLILIGAAWKAKLGEPRPEPDTIAYHYEQWLHQQENLTWGADTNRLGIKKVIWYIDGKPSMSDRMRQMMRHENFLIRAGFLETRSFELEGVYTSQFLPTFNKRAKQAGLILGARSFRGPDSALILRSTLGADGNKQRTAVYFTARKEDMLGIEAIIKDINADTTNRMNQAGASAHHQPSVR